MGALAAGPEHANEDKKRPEPVSEAPHIAIVRRRPRPVKAHAATAHGAASAARAVRQKLDAKAGDIVVVEPGKAHKFKNIGEEGAAMRVRVTPALEMERLFEAAVGLAQDGRVTKKGMPKPLDLALFVGEFKDEVRGPGSPGWLQRATLAPLAFIARRRGRAERYVPATPAFA